MTLREVIETIWGTHGLQDFAGVCGVDVRTARRWVVNGIPEARREEVRRILVLHGVTRSMDIDKALASYEKMS